MKFLFATGCILCLLTLACAPLHAAFLVEAHDTGLGVENFCAGLKPTVTVAPSAVASTVPA